MALVSGPFTKLEGRWLFKALQPTASKVELRLDFETTAGPLGQLFAPFFEDIAESMVDAFVSRARQNYGPSHD